MILSHSHFLLHCEIAMIPTSQTDRRTLCSQHKSATSYYSIVALKKKRKLDLQTHAVSKTDNAVTLTFDLLTSESAHAQRLSTKFWIYSSSRFPFRAWTHIDTKIRTNEVTQLIAMHQGAVKVWGPLGQTLKLLIRPNISITD